ncbi:hypothetical protein HZF24_10245 [Sedimentibacter hydroxybenzoicus DSM 7310]|uniref:Tetratricopeptide repeat-containing protein n=1 Tax=Sedimentibacter hydroxybenzoicus DSM 7310 TaxID=1123245 RepID=A0A974GWX7_SEDHY|nr:tetratricopeptide repeat protein [Sedimentibacter hydroxybenzoicus]NYB74515.1 hypothetical protein [Sedimentibacter hydroxybenzoicus DSM 7310]
MVLFNDSSLFKSHIPAKEFINRETPRNIFYSAIDNSNTLKKNVIMYYGIGGIGKSSLIKNLKDYANKKNILYSFVDFDDPAFRLPFKALIELKKNLNIPMPHFDVAAALCFIKRNPELKFNDKSLFEGNAIKIMKSMSSLEQTGILTSILGLTEVIYDKYADKIKLNKEIKKHLEILKGKSSNEIEKELPDYFAYDVIKFLYKENRDNCVFFFDTYESLWDKGRNESNRLKNDSWIRRLVLNIPNAIFVISGREKIQWELEDEQWSTNISYVSLDVLRRDFAVKYLDICEIKDEKIQSKIIDSAKGHPYYLDLCVDTYYKLLNTDRQISVDSFGRGRIEIQECFLKNLSDSEINTLRVLVIPRFYDNIIFELLINTFQTGYSVINMESFNSFSFVKRDKNNKYFIHVLMRDEIKSHMSEQLKTSVNAKMVSYYENKLSDRDIFVDDIKYLFAELLYHLKDSCTDQDLVNYIENNQLQIIKKLQFSGETSYLLDQFLDLFYTNKSTIEGTEFFSIMIDMIHLSGKYSEAVQIISDYLGSFSLKDIVNSSYRLDLFIRKVHHMMFYTPLKTLKYEMDKVMNVFSEQENLRIQYCEILFMMGAHIYLPLGDFENAKSCLNKSICIARAIGSNNLICRGLRKYSELLCAKGKLDAAERICKTAIEIADKNSLTRYELYLNCVLGEINRLNGLVNESIKIFDDALPVATSLGIKGWIGHINLSLGNCYADLGNYDLAKEFYEKALCIYNDVEQKWGIINASYAIQRLLLISGNAQNIAMLDHLSLESKRMGYTKISKYIEQTKNGELHVFHFEFL